jgi:hypothetical protein
MGQWRVSVKELNGETGERAGDWKWEAKAKTTWCLPRFPMRATVARGHAKIEDNGTGRLETADSGVSAGHVPLVL